MLCTSGFVDDVILFLGLIERMGRIRHDAYVSSSSSVGGTGAEYAVSDCILFKGGLPKMAELINPSEGMYNVSQKTRRLIFDHNFGKFRPIFKIVLPLIPSKFPLHVKCVSTLPCENL